MKKIVLVALALVVALSAGAQDKRWFVNGSADFGWYKVKEVQGSYTAFELTPSINYKLSNNWAIGLGVKYGYERVSDANYIVEDSWVGVAPRVTYIAKIAPNFYYVPNAQLSWDYGFESKDMVFGIAVAPLSFEYRVSKCLGLVFKAGSLGFDYYMPDAEGASDSYGAYIHLNKDLGFGFNFYF